MQADYNANKLAIMVLCCLTSVSAAQDKSLFDLSLDELLSLKVVTNGKSEQRLEKTPRALYVLTQEDIRNSGATVLPEVLRMVPGVQVSQISAHRWAVSIRGFHQEFSDKLLVLIDGRTIYTPVFSGVHWDANDINLSEIERIEVLRGPGSVAWGANAVNGVINIITKSATSTTGEIRNKLTLESPERSILETYYGSSHENWYWRASFRRLDQQNGSRPEYTFNSTPLTTANDSWNNTRLGLRVDKQGEHRFSFKSDIYRTYINDVVLNVPFIAPARTEDFTAKGKLSGYHFNLDWSHPLTSNSLIKSQIIFNRDERRDISSISTQSTLDWALQYNLDRDAHKIILGIGWRQNDDTLSPSNIAYFVPEKSRHHTLNAFVLDRWHLSKNFHLNYGVKLENYETVDSEVHPKIGWLYQQGASTYWMNMESAIRSPNRLNSSIRVNSAPIPADQFFPGQPEGFVQLIGNPNLEVESLKAIEFGFRHHTHTSFNWEIAVYKNRYRNLILLHPQNDIGTPFIDEQGVFIVPLLTLNNAQGDIYGLEYSFNWQASDRTRVSGNFSKINMDIRGTPTATVINNLSPEHQAHIRGYFHLADGWNFQSALSYTDVIYDNNEKLNSHTSLDIRFSKELSADSEWYFGIRNLLDSKHIEKFSDGFTVNAYVERQLYLGIDVSISTLE